MLPAQTCLVAMMDPSVEIEHKTRVLGQYLADQSALSGALRLPLRHIRAMAIRRLFSELPTDDGAAKQALQTVLDRIVEKGKQEKAQALDQSGQSEILAERMRSLQSGTAILVHNGNGMHLAVLLGVRGRCFTFELPDGQRHTVPARFFIGIAMTDMPRLAEDERQRRILVRKLGEDRAEQAAERILNRGEEMLDPLFIELTAALQRIRANRRQIVMALRAVGAEVQGADRVLIRQARQLLLRLARKLGTECILRHLQQHADEAVHKFVHESLAEAATEPGVNCASGSTTTTCLRNIGYTRRMVSFNMPSDPGKFDGFDKMCREAKENGIACVIVDNPQVLGDNYTEIVGNLNKLAQANLMLSIVSAKPLL